MLPLRHTRAPGYCRLSVNCPLPTVCPRAPTRPLCVSALHLHSRTNAPRRPAAAQSPQALLCSALHFSRTSPEERLVSTLWRANQAQKVKQTQNSCSSSPSHWERTLDPCTDLPQPGSHTSNHMAQTSWAPPLAAWGLPPTTSLPPALYSGASLQLCPLGQPAGHTLTTVPCLYAWHLPRNRPNTCGTAWGHRGHVSVLHPSLPLSLLAHPAWCPQVQNPSHHHGPRGLARVQSL